MFVDLWASTTRDAPTGVSTLASAHLWVFATEVAVHGGAGGNLGPAEVTRLRFHLLVSQVDVLLQHVLRQVLLIARGTRPRLPHCSEKIGLKRIGFSTPSCRAPQYPLGRVWRRRRSLACVNQLVRFQSRPLAEGLSTQLAHEVLDACGNSRPP